MRRFQVIYVAGDTPYECGRQYGQQAQEKIRAGVEVYRDFFGKTSGQTWPEIKKYAASYPVSYTHLTLPTKRIV